MKLTKKDIPQRTQLGSYRIDIDWADLTHWVERQVNKKELGKTSSLDLNPDFQRGHVWTEEQQRSYVEYKLQNGVGADVLYFNCKEWMNTFEGPFVIVDGLQRLTAVLKFLNNELRVFKNIKDNPDGFLFEDFDNIRTFKAASFQININNLKTRKEVLHWYLEMNQQGTPHTDEELMRVKELLENETTETSI